MRDDKNTSKVYETDYSDFATKMDNNAVIEQTPTAVKPLYDDTTEQTKAATDKPYLAGNVLGAKNISANMEIGQGVTATVSADTTDDDDEANLISDAQNVLTETYSTGKLSAEDYATKYGKYDATAYRQAEAQLDYDWHTMLANYGHNAEKLAQMGLGGSGVSDAYGSSAYAAYVKSKMQLKIQEVEAQKAAKQAYATYSDEYDSKQESNIVSAYNALISSGKYNGGNVQSLATELVNQGYTQYEAQEAAKRLLSLDATELENARTMNGYSLISESYAETDEAKKAVKETLKKNGYTTKEINQILDYANKQYAGVASTIPSATETKTLKTLGVTDIKTALELANTYEDNEDADSLIALYDMLMAAGYSEEQLTPIYNKAKKLK